MPPVWGEKYLKKLGLESWEQLEWLAKQKLEQDDREWKAKIGRETNQEVRTQRHAPQQKATSKVISNNEETPSRRRRRRRRIIKAKQEHHQAPAPASHAPLHNPDDEQGPDGMSRRSVDDELPDAEDNEPKLKGSKASFASGSEDIP
ncbi:hypothetical protein LCI18_008742 [Fusarium solani-melongenae]|uniref:Uncharacterized protein n=1 Tax=Fusarium solani subsp. cucurbitae TaxID=2747967 RepID=A0ACD3Z9N9_FUSSC|nr:hypothetical protein LCI18_008742 [Fusarium solani-melongenae]